MELQFLNHFATELNNRQITYNTSSTVTISAIVSDNLLIITQSEPERKFHFNAFNTVIGANNTIFLDKGMTMIPMGGNQIYMFSLQLLVIISIKCARPILLDMGLAEVNKVMTLSLIY